MFARDEYQAMEEENHLIFIENVQPIMEARQAVLVDLDYALNDEIWLEPTPGHSAGHVAVHLKSGRHHAVMCGDLMHTPLQLAEPGWTPTFEYDMAASTNTRTKFLDTHCNTDTLILTAHFPSPSIGHIIPRGNGYDFAYL
jgi:glyoxylase-like metal-dependent hydrolase (beta-lactamase superfamily II)